MDRDDPGRMWDSDSDWDCGWWEREDAGGCIGGGRLGGEEGVDGDRKDGMRRDAEKKGGDRDVCGYDEIWSDVQTHDER